MTKSQLSRIWYSIIVVSVVWVIPTNIVLAARDNAGEFSEPIGRAINVLCYFTILSNFLVGVASYFLASNPESNTPRKNIIYLTALVDITVTAVVYRILLAPIDHQEGLGVITNLFVHYIIPVMYVVGWFVFAPRGRTDGHVLKWAIIIPIVWAIFAMIRGAFVKYYPYPFMDVRDLGYAMALINMAVVTVFFLLLFYGAHKLDQWLTRRQLSKTAIQ